jgi:hypothetical protein
MHDGLEKGLRKERMNTWTNTFGGNVQKSGIHASKALLRRSSDRIQLTTLMKTSGPIFVCIQ